MISNIISILIKLMIKWKKFIINQIKTINKLLTKVQFIEYSKIPTKKYR